MSHEKLGAASAASYHQNRTCHSIPHRGGSSRRSSTPACSVPPARHRRTLAARPLSVVTPTVAFPRRTMGTTILGTPVHSRGLQHPELCTAPAPPRRVVLHIGGCRRRSLPGLYGSRRQAGRGFARPPV